MDEGFPHFFLREMNSLKQLKHKNIVQLLDVDIGYSPNEQTKKVNLIFEFIERGSLSDYWKLHRLTYKEEGLPFS